MKLQLGTIPVFWSNQQYSLKIITRKYEINVMYCLVGLLKDDFGISCYNVESNYSWLKCKFGHLSHNQY